eukprot:Em0085g3a
MESWTTGLSVETVIMEPFPNVQLCKIKSSKSFGQQLSGGVCKGIPTGLKQSRPGCDYGQVKKLRWDDDDSIVKHKLATMAVREKPLTSAARIVDARARPPRGSARRRSAPVTTSGKSRNAMETSIASLELDIIF